MDVADRLDLVGRHAGLLGELPPPGDRGGDFAGDGLGAAPLHRGGLGDGLQVLECETVGILSGATSMPLRANASVY